jgi:predicted 3-demethylubiquinone-9 3-methyltransferase (glyoxalase superfamily)
MPAMNKLAPFLWFNDNAEEAAEFYLSIFAHASGLDELCSKGVGQWPVGKIATITIELEGQEMVFLNGGPSNQLNPAFSFFVRCDSQEEIDSYWDKLIEGGNPMACGSWKSAWQHAKKVAGVECRWRDIRHSFVSRVAASGATDQTIQQMAG